MKTLFLFNIQSISDIITNSSSELFVFKENSIESVISILDDIYPNWRDEYEEPIRLQDLSYEDLEDFIIYHLLYYIQYGTENLEKQFRDPIKLAKKKALKFTEKSVNILQKYFNIHIKSKDIYEDSENTYKMFLPFNLRREMRSWYPKLKSEVYFLIKNSSFNGIFLYSKDEDPDWNYQEKLMEVAESIIQDENIYYTYSKCI